MKNVYKICFVLQIINFHSPNTSVTNKNNRASLKLVLAEFQMQVCQKKNYLRPSIVLFMEDDRMWMLHLDIVEILLFYN